MSIPVISSVVAVHEEFDRAGIAVLGGLGETQRITAQVLSLLSRQIRCRCPLDDLLIAPLHAAIALEKVHEIAMRVAENLDLDVTSPLDEFLQIHLVVAEGSLGLTPCGSNTFLELRRLANHTHAATAATPARLEHERITNLRCKLRGSGRVLGQRPRRRHDGDAGFLRQLPGTDLIPECAHDRGWRSYENNAGLCAGIREIRILRQKAVTRMNRIDTGLLGDAQHGLDIEVRSKRTPGRAELVALVGLEPMQCEAVFLRVYGDGADSELRGCAHDADRDLATVSDE
jgi:hypothetical protein